MGNRRRRETTLRADTRFLYSIYFKLIDSVDLVFLIVTIDRRPEFSTRQYPPLWRRRSLTTSRIDFFIVYQEKKNFLMLYIESTHKLFLIFSTWQRPLMTQYEIDRNLKGLKKKYDITFDPLRRGRDRVDVCF